MIRPRRALRLQIDTHTVGSSKGSLWWTIAMEAHMVQPIFLAFLEQIQPFLLISRRKARLRKATVLHGATQEQGTLVNKHLAISDADLPETYERLHHILASLNSQSIEVRMKLVPHFNIRIDRKFGRNLIPHCIHRAATNHLSSFRTKRISQRHIHHILIQWHQLQPIRMVFQQHLYPTHLLPFRSSRNQSAILIRIRQGYLDTVHLHADTLHIQFLPLCL